MLVFTLLQHKSSNNRVHLRTLQVACDLPFVFFFPLLLPFVRFLV